ncbi:glycosyltransferase family 4 protein [Pedobacter yonginense]|nr:glycosyltransferase family 4 protein [Pedobacter yonginense]
MRQSFEKVVKDVKPDVAISVLYHFYSVALAQLCAKIKLPSILFLHDRWDNKTADKSAQQIRFQYGAEAISKSSYVLSVTEHLVEHYVKDSVSNCEIFPPIPEGYHGISEKGAKQTIVYAGSVNQYHIQLFDQILKVLALKNYTLLVITNELAKLNTLTKTHKNLIAKQALPSNTEAMGFIADNASAILVNYGLSEADNPDAFYSFPSKFIEFVHLNIPIIASAPKDSPFHSFLTDHNWPFMLGEPTAESMTKQLENLNNLMIVDQCFGIQRQLAAGIFNPDKIQERLESIINQAIKTIDSE